MNNQTELEWINEQIELIQMHIDILKYFYYGNLPGEIVYDYSPSVTSSKISKRFKTFMHQKYRSIDDIYPTKSQSFEVRMPRNYKHRELSLV